MKHEPTRWISDYERTGYLVVEDCLSAATLAALRKAIEKITADPDSLPTEIKRHLDFERDYVKKNPQYNDLSPQQVGNALRSIRELPLLDPVFADFIVYPPVLDVLQNLFGNSEFSFFNCKCIIKAPLVSSRFRWHRDQPYVQYTSPNLITAMLCLDDMTGQNGATIMLPGTHRISHDKDNPADMDIQDKDLPDGPRVMVTCPAASLVLFHGSVIHGGGANRSDKPRRNIISIWAGPENLPIAAKRYACEGLMPRSVKPERQRQLYMSFPHLFPP
ncbi:MAG: phytanoyl-CoA dioxygenase family protein [Lacunisphaera sp.]|nr:phytanoyl-CoA dioxygenase family protein [Lacunisphaera sp.]